MYSKSPLGRGNASWQPANGRREKGGGGGTSAVDTVFLRRREMRGTFPFSQLC